MEDKLRKALLDWFDENGRKFYWRNNCDSYGILIAEILLKKTTANAVDHFLPFFLEHYPNMKSLENESSTKLQEFLTPLGLSKQRSAQLKNLAQKLNQLYRGIIPCNKEDLLKLPGVGDYTAGAFLSFACDAPEAIVDVNIARLITRIFGIKPSHCEARRSPEVWEKARQLVGQNGTVSKKINWALLDLAATVCKAKNPLHTSCPVKRCCISFD